MSAESSVIIHKEMKIKERYINSMIRFAYFLQSWLPYRSTKRFIYNLLENESYPYKRYFDYFMLTVILSSIAILVADVKKPVPQWLDNYDLYAVTTLFICEYLLRMWVYSDIHTKITEAYEEHLIFDTPISLRTLAMTILKDKWRYMTTPSAIIDLIALLPSYRGIRVLRVFILFRAFKMLRYTRSLSSFLEILKYKKTELLTLLSLTTFFVFIAGIMLYVFEGNKNPNIHTIFDAFYWALVTISTVGYGDISPVTDEGRAVSMMIIITGIGLISFITSVIVSAFGEHMQVLKEERLVQDMGKRGKITVICGFGTMGRLAAKGLAAEGHTFVVIDKNPDIVQEAQALGYHTLCADATQSEIFIKLHIENRISHMLALNSDERLNALMTINVKSLNPQVHVTVRCKDPEMIENLQHARVDHIVTPEEIGGRIGAIYAENPVASDLAFSIIGRKLRTQAEAFTVASGTPLENRRIAEINPDAFKLILLGVVRPGGDREERFIFNPPDDFIVTANDRLICIGYDFALEKLRKEVSHVAAA